MTHKITITILCDYDSCDEEYSAPEFSRVRRFLREERGWATTEDTDGTKKDYCARHWRMILEEAEREGLTLHDGEWISTDKLKQYGWRGLLDGGSSEGITR